MRNVDLRAFDIDDIMPVLRMLEEPDTKILLDVPERLSDKHVHGWLSRLKTGSDFAVVDADSGELCGGVFVAKDMKHNTGLIWYWIGEKWRGRGYATEAVKLVTKNLFDQNIHKLHAWVAAPNKSSSSVLEKAGFSIEGVQREQRLMNGKYVDLVLFGLINPKTIY